jgi:YfiH family protein
MTMLTHPLLARAGVAHGFGVRGAPEPAGLLRPRQVHGREVATPAEFRPAAAPPEADAIVSREPGVPVGVATADCVPILCASLGGELVGAVHAGWRGLARGVVAAGVDAMRRSDARAEIVAVIGPHIGPCCYEVDGPVLDALRRELGDEPVAKASAPTRPGHARIDLGALSAVALARAGVAPARIAQLPSCCTRCDPTRFHSYRRDGARAGRLIHHIAARLDRLPARG